MGSTEVPITAAMVAGFVAIHVFIGRLHFIDVTPRSKWLSFSGGVAVSYIFLHVLPQLGAHALEFSDEMGLPEVAAESVVYALALTGLVAFYGVERKVKISRAQSSDDKMEGGVLGLHIAIYALLNLLIGYLLLHREAEGYWALALYFGAMALHFLTADFGMRKDHEQAYDDYGRWLIAGAVTLGWAVGLIVGISEVAIGGLFAFVAGAVTLNVLKEELPEERQSYFLAFLGGVTVYAALVLMERNWA